MLVNLKAPFTGNPSDAAESDVEVHVIGGDLTSVKSVAPGVLQVKYYFDRDGNGPLFVHVSAYGMPLPRSPWTVHLSAGVWAVCWCALVCGFMECVCWRVWASGPGCSSFCACVCQCVCVYACTCACVCGCVRACAYVAHASASGPVVLHHWLALRRSSVSTAPLSQPGPRPSPRL